MLLITKIITSKSPQKIFRKYVVCNYVGIPVIKKINIKIRKKLKFLNNQFGSYNFH